MKWLFLPLWLCCFMLAHAQEDTLRNESKPLSKRLQSLSLSDYVEKPTDSVLTLFPSRFKHSINTSDQPLFTHTVWLRFVEHPYLIVKLYYRTLKRANPNAIRRRKQLRELRKEIVSHIEIHTSSVCLNGCER